MPPNIRIATPVKTMLRDAERDWEGPFVEDSVASSEILEEAEGYSTEPSLKWSDEGEDVPPAQ